MAKLIDSLLSGSSGKVGRVVVSNLYGTEILRKRPRRRTSEPTAKQQLIQTRMTLSYQFLNPYKEFAKKYFGKRIGMRSPYNLAMSSVMKAFKLDFDLMEIIPEYNKIEFTKGNLMAPLPVDLTSADPNSFTLEWFDNSGGDTDRENDQLQLLFIADGEFKPTLIENAATRADGIVQIPLANTFSGMDVHVWMTFIDEDGTQAANSAYAGTVLIS